MYNKIVNPKTGKNVNINTNKGKQILNNYLNQLGGDKNSSKMSKIVKDIRKRQKTVLPKNIETACNSFIEAVESGIFIIEGNTFRFANDNIIEGGGDMSGDEHHFSHGAFHVNYYIMIASALAMGFMLVGEAARMLGLISPPERRRNN